MMLLKGMRLGHPSPWWHLFQLCRRGDIRASSRAFGMTEEAMDWARRCSLLIGLCASLVGCHHPEITAIPLSPWNCSEQPGIPFYLPKPLLIITKNFRSIEEAKVGLTNSVPIPDTFDNQAGYADVNARMSDVTSDSTKPASKAESGTTAPAGSDVASGQHLFSDQGPPVVPVPTTDLLRLRRFTHTRSSSCPTSRRSTV